MRARKILKVTAISVASLALLLLFLVAFFLFNPFEGSLPEMRDVVPRGVDFYVQKARLAGDFDGEGGTDAFPYVPALVEIGDTAHWRNLKRGKLYAELGITDKLKSLRAEFVKMRKDLSFIHLVDDLIGREVQVAGFFGPTGIDDAKFCAYTRISWRGKAAYGALGQGFVREQMASQGIQVAAEGDIYKLTIKKDVFYLARHLDCAMFGNDRKLIEDSLKLADGNREDVEPLGTSAHYKDGVREPQDLWLKRTGVLRKNMNALELHLRPDQLLPKLPDWRNWPDPNKDDARNEKILASFINPESYRFLSGSVVFEPYSITMLSHLVVNNNLLTPFQKGIFEGEATPRQEWMNQFFRLVPREACGAAALKMPAGAFIREMFRDVLEKVEREEIDRAIRATRKYQSFDDLVEQLALSLRPRVGIILRPNRRSPKSIASFKVQNESPFPQWAWVFWVKKSRKTGRVLNQPLQDLIEHVNSNRRAFGIVNAFKLGLSGKGVQSDVAFEFAMPFVPGTGSVAAATVGEYFIFGNSGPFIYSMVQGFTRNESRSTDPDFEEFVSEMPDAINGAVFLWADALQLVAEDFETFAKTASGPMDAAWAVANRSRAEAIAFRRPAWRVYGTKARIPADKDEAFQNAVDVELQKMWTEQRAKNQIGAAETRKQFTELSRSFRSAYLQMVLTETSLRVWGRALDPNYNR